MNQLSRSIVLLSVVIVITALVPIFGCPSPSQGQSDLADRVAALEAKLAYITVQQGKINGLKGPHLIIEGCNVHVRSGSGDSLDGTVDRANQAELPGTTPTGRGNLIVGYNETPLDHDPERGGSHNLIVGPGHDFTSVGSAVFGQENRATRPAASVTGGWGNEADGYAASVSGGTYNQATSFYASVSGGWDNEAAAAYSSVSGGKENTANGIYASISGGEYNIASGQYSSVAGGRGNVASGDYSRVSGGILNKATGYFSSVSGGWGNQAGADYSSASGGEHNAANGFLSSVSGGFRRAASGDYDWVAGELFQDK